MPLINHSISSLFNGVSQQSASIRQPGQADLQENAFSSVVRGVHKRHPTNHTAKLTSDKTNGAYVHIINRDAVERYAVVIENNNIRVWGIDGIQRTVTAPNGFAYLASGTPQTDFAVITIADYTFIVNKTKATAMSPSFGAQQQFSFTLLSVPIPGTSPNGYISITVNGQNVTIGAQSTDTASFMAQFVTAFNKIFAGTINVTQTGSTILFQAISSATTILGSASVVDATTGGPVSNPGRFTSSAGVAAVASEVQTFSKLPATGVSGTVYKITGDNSNSFGSYYVQWNGVSYVETTIAGLNNYFDPLTMPFQLVRNADGTFTFGPATWKPRLIGDLVSAANPSFVGRPISDVFFFRNRLGFLCGENVIFSRAGSFFSFFPSTATQVLDTDPIDISVSHIKVSNLRHAIPFSRNLVLFSDQTQFVLTATDILTPRTVTVNQTTEFECSPKAKPVASGSNIYFAVDRTGFTGMREYYVANYQLTFDADDVTGHVPRYIPGGVSKMVASTTEDLIFALSTQDPTSVYVYKYYWSGDEKTQSSWSRWTLGSDATILSMEMLNTKLMMVVQRPDGLYLEYIDVQIGLKETDLPILVSLDRKVSVTGTFNPQTNRTTWTMPYPASGVQMVLSGAFVGKVGVLINSAQQDSPTTYSAPGDYSMGPVYAGVNYTMRYRFSPQYARDANKTAIAEAILKLRNMRVFFTDSGYFRVEVTPKARDTAKYIWAGKVLGSTALKLGSVQTDSGVFKFPVLSDSVTAKIELVNDTYLPCFFQSAEWEAMMTLRSQRM